MLNKRVGSLALLGLLATVGSACSSSRTKTNDTAEAAGVSTGSSSEQMAETVRSATRRLEKWIAETDPQSGKTKFRCDLRRTESFMNPYVATCGYWLYDDVEIEYQFGLQQDHWVFTKGTWTAHHANGREHVSDHNGGAERRQLAAFLSD